MRIDQLSESHLRSRAKRAGLRLCKSPARTPRDPQFGRFFIADDAGNFAVYGAWPLTYSASLEECAAYVDKALAA